MEDLVVRLIGECRLQEAVAMSNLENGLHVFAYPLPHHGVLLAIGVGPDAALTGEELLARRTARLQWAGGWLPAMFNDGSLYLVRRLDADEEEGGEALVAQLDVALDMLN
jgi:hypothetical protein